MANTNKQRLVFLLGSGISYKAGMPPIGEITKKVLCGEFYFYDGDFYPKKISRMSENLEKAQEEEVQRIVKFLNILKVEIDYYYEKHRRNHDANYEDLYYMAKQIYDSQFEKYDNPSIQPLFDKISCCIQPLLEKSVTVREMLPYELIKLSMRYIEKVVSLELNKKLNPLDYLACIKEACEDKDFSTLDVFTLNHDTVLEKFFELNKIRFSDAFDTKPKLMNGFKVRFWNPDLFNESTKVKLFKLHGSIDWCLFFIGNQRDEVVGILLDPIPSHIKNVGQEGGFDIKRNFFLVGTTNKILEYTTGIYQELRFQFYKSLRQTNQIVICGYGFGDEGINTEILEWIYSSSKNRLIVIHPRPKELRKKAAPPMRRLWDKRESQKKLVVIQNGIEKTSWQELKRSLFENIR